MYTLNQFKNLGIFIDRPPAESVETEGGRVISSPDVPSKIIDMLRTPGGETYQGDFSRQDSAVVTSLLAAGYAAEDVRATFTASARGRHALERKNGHYDDYIKRTIAKAVGYLKSKNGSNGNDNGQVSIDFARRRAVTTKSGLVVAMANEVEIEKVRWIWPSYIPAGKLTILAGDPGMGKSTLTIDIISRLSKGSLLPDGKRGLTGTSLIASAEDAPEDTMVPRLVAAGADLKRVGFLREIRESSDLAEDQTRFLSLPRDLEILRETLVEKGARILVIDPLNAFLEKGTDTYKDQDMRRVLHPLEAIAEETGTSILVVAHLTKKEDTSTLYRVGGSIGFIGAARSVMAVTRIADGSRVLYSLKSNLAATPPSLSYETKQVRKQRTNGQWKGEEIVHSSGIRWLGEVDFDPNAKGPGRNTADGEEATSFLKQVLQDAGELDTEIIFREARSAGISKSTLNALRGSLGITAVKKGANWTWRWPAKKS